MRHSLLRTVTTSTVSADSQPPLAFHDGRFKILQFTDLHLGYNGDPVELEKAGKTLKLIRTMLEKEKPDLALVTGDVVTLEAKGIPGGTASVWRKMAVPFEEAQVPFAVAFGNHDQEWKESVAEQLTVIQESPWNRTYSDDPSVSGAGNCWLPIHNADGQEVWRIWLFDSHSYRPLNGKWCDAWIRFDQIKWYRKASQNAPLYNGAQIPGLAFFHIPLWEHWEIHNAEGTLGTGNEDPCPGGLNSGLFSAFVEQGNIRGVFAGHDHNNDYIAFYQGIPLGYGRKTGFGSYGELVRGGRVFELSEDGGYKTYLSTPHSHENDWVYSEKEKNAKE